MENKGLYAQIKENATTYKPSNLKIEDLKKAFDDVYESMRKNPRPKVQISAWLGVEMSCDTLKSIAKSNNWIFWGGLEAIEALQKKCKECGIE